MDANENTYHLILASGEAVKLVENGVPIQEVKLRTLASNKRNGAVFGMISEYFFKSEEEMIESINTTKELFSFMNKFIGWKQFRIVGRNQVVEV